MNLTPIVFMLIGLAVAFSLLSTTPTTSYETQAAFPVSINQAVQQSVENYNQRVSRYNLNAPKTYERFSDEWTQPIQGLDFNKGYTSPTLGAECNLM